MVLGGDILVVVFGCGQKTHFGQAMTVVFHLCKVVVLLVLMEDHLDASIFLYGENKDSKCWEGTCGGGS